VKIGFLFAALTLASANAYATNLNGTWTGAGKISDNKGMNVSCERIALTIVHTPTVLNVSSDFTCAGQRTNAPGGNLEVRGGDVYSNGVKVGQLTATSITLSMASPQGNMSTSAVFNDKQMTFKTVTTSTQQPGYVATFEGVVQR